MSCVYCMHVYVYGTMWCDVVVQVKRMNEHSDASHTNNNLIHNHKSRTPIGEWTDQKLVTRAKVRCALMLENKA